MPDGAAMEGESRGLEGCFALVYPTATLSTWRVGESRGRARASCNPRAFRGNKRQ
jgi:hypothetical protein